MNVNEATRRHLLALPKRRWDDDRPEYDSVLILPGDRKHDSGWRAMAIIGCRGQEPVEICCLGCDDIEWEIARPLERYGPMQEWAIGQLRTDCAWGSRGVHVWTRTGHFRVGPALSSVRITLS